MRAREVVAIAGERAGHIYLLKVETRVRSSVAREDMPLPPSLLVIGLGPTGVEVALAIAESGRCCLCLGDDALASTEWRKSASCLLQRRPTAASDSSSSASPALGAGKAVKRSQFLSAMLAPLGTQSITAISPVGDASIVERFDVVVMTDPTLPHAIAFSEHVSCSAIFDACRSPFGTNYLLLPSKRHRIWRDSLRPRYVPPYCMPSPLMKVDHMLHSRM